MKKTLLALLVISSIASAQPPAAPVASPAIPPPPVAAAQPPAPLVELTAGVFKHAQDVIARVIEITETRIVVECTRGLAAPIIIMTSPASLSQPSVWREVYVITDGKIALKEIVKPKVVPPVPAYMDWEHGTSEQPADNKVSAK